MNDLMIYTAEDVDDRVAREGWGDEYYDIEDVEKQIKLLVLKNLNNYTFESIQFQLDVEKLFDI